MSDAPLSAHDRIALMKARQAEQLRREREADSSSHTVYNRHGRPVTVVIPKRGEPQNAATDPLP